MSAVSWWGYGIASTILVMMLGGMFVFIRAMSDPSGRYQEVKEMVEALFHTPAFLRPGGGEEQADTSRAQAAAAHEPFEDECPACRAKVTHENIECPSCGLRLLG